MRRRDFISLLGGAVAWPIAARAQEAGRTYRLGFVLPIGRQTPPVVASFDELRLNGFIEGTNLATVAGSFGLEGSTPAERAATVVKGAPDLYRVPEIVTLERLPGEGGSDSRWRTREVRHVGPDNLTPGF